MTLEELQAKVLELEEQNKLITEERDNLKKSSEDLNKRITDLQEHNQKLFLKLTKEEPQKEEEKESIKSLEDVAIDIMKGDNK